LKNERRNSKLETKGRKTEFAGLLFRISALKFRSSYFGNSGPSGRPPNDKSDGKGRLGGQQDHHHRRAKRSRKNYI
jgi:hypothetical protein